MQAELTSESMLDTAGAAEVLGVKPRTLTKWRSTREVGVPFVRVGRSVRYRLGDLRDFIAANRETLPS